jgi:hypothetical protein
VVVVVLLHHLLDGLVVDDLFLLLDHLHGPPHPSPPLTQSLHLVCALFCTSCCGMGVVQIWSCYSPLPR